LIVRCIIKSGFARYSFLGTAPTLEHTHSIWQRRSLFI
jgi:hypothetical protein